jgi:hypothetical protein
MTVSKRTMLVVGFAAVALAAGAGRLALAQQPTGDVVGEIANNTGYFVDGKTFKIVKGQAKDNDASAQFAKLQKMGAKEVGTGLIVFRYADKLYMVEGTPTPSPQAMKDFQSNWNVSYMNAQKDFQSNWNVSYMKAAKDFQDNWNTSYMKNFQDNWNTSYMKTTKDFQDNFSTSYMK